MSSRFDNKLAKGGITSRYGLMWVLLSAVSFSLAGVLIKLVPWHAVSLNGARCVFAIIPLYLYLRATGRRFHVNKQIVLGAIVYAAMLITFVLANKMTTAANAIVLQFTEPIWVIVAGVIIFHNKPSRVAIVACVAMFIGVVLFFVDSLDAGGMVGNVLAIVSGITYAGVFLLKQFPEVDFECSAILGFVICFVTAIPFYAQETVFNAEVFAAIVLLGVVQLGFGVLFLSFGLNSVSPVTASLTSTIEPILNPILVALVVGETIGPVAMIGAVFVIVTAAAYNVYEAKKKTLNS